ncbi:Bromodomain [Penicillium lagena]|uniref:Bromodomain n=1 Tax=Penicillium lagena TaxID=94218 RepID=UPI0025407853|nr:Bromodomain [Penicillium lagena]KAJ5605680.1 Bromodomain [Penicillium lagena]
MATPPPEAPPLVKEDKPQLPPSPTGVAAPDLAPMSVQNMVSDLKQDVPPTLPEITPTAVNGHTPGETAIANGTNTAASPPKSPAPPAPVDSEPPSSSVPAETPSAAQPSIEPSLEPSVEPSIEPPTATELKKESPEDRATPSQGPTQESATPAAETPANNVVVFPPSRQGPANTGSEPPAQTDGAADTPDKMDIETPQDMSASVKTELPHHLFAENKSAGPHDPAAASSTPPVLPSLQTDQEMKDAPPVPMSPTKIAREREVDGGEEPAAKRTKVEGEDSATTETKAPKLPTPGTETPGPAPPASGESGVTKLQQKFISKCLTSLKRMHDARFYKVPVDPVALNIPNYPNVIKQPMDLGTVEKKLKANEYSSPQGVIDDVALMVQNAQTFNGPDHLVTQEGHKLRATFEKQMANLPKPDEVEEKKPKKVAEKTSAARREPRTSTGGPVAPPKATSPQGGTTFALGPEGLPTIRRDSSNPDGRPKRSIHPPKRDLPYSTKPKKKKFQWELKFCQEVLDELHKGKYYEIAAPFYLPVDPVALNIPNYHSVIKKPMDLSTVQNKLRSGQYENAKEFEIDIRQMLKNCFRFNMAGDIIYAAGQRLEEVFNWKWSHKASYLESHEPHHYQHSDSSDEDSDEEEDESDEDDERLTLLQQQIAEMSRQVEAITQKKKKTPPSSKKAGKKSGKKDSKKSSAPSGKKDKKIKSSKSDKPRWVSYHEKQIISNGISSLPDKKMQEALKIIQNNVPALKGTQEAEIELDIDELPNDVLLMLLKFVKKNVPHIMDDEDSAPASNLAAPKPKKNKPMSKYEQEAQINMLESNLSRFQGGGSPNPMPSVEAMESSDDEDEDSEESEEE